MSNILSHIRTSKSTRGRYIDLPYNITNSQSNFSVGRHGVFSKYIWTIELDASRRFIQEKFSRRDKTLTKITRDEFLREVKGNNSRFFKSVKVNGVLQSGMTMQIPENGKLWNTVPHSYDSAAFEEFELGSHGTETLVRMCMNRGALQGFNIQDFTLSIKSDQFISPAIFKYAKGSPEVPIYIAFFDRGESIENLRESKVPTPDPRLTPQSFLTSNTLKIGETSNAYSSKRGASFQISHAAFKGKYFDHNHLPFRSIKTETRTFVHISNSLWESPVKLDGESNRIILDVGDVEDYFKDDYAQYISYTEAFFEPKVLTDSEDPHVSQISLKQRGVHRRYSPLTRFHGMPTISVVESVTHALVPVKLTKLLAADFIGLDNFGIGNEFQITLGPLIYVTYSNDNLNIVIEVDSAIGDIPDRVVINSVTSVKNLYKVVEVKVRCEYIVKDVFRKVSTLGYGRDGLPAIIEYVCSEADFTEEFGLSYYDFLFGIVSKTSKCYENAVYRALENLAEIPYRRFDDFEYLNIYEVLKHVLPNLPLKTSRREWWNNGVKIFETSDANFPDRI